MTNARQARGGILIEPTAPVVLVGPKATAPGAAEFVAETMRLLHSYAREIVGAFRLRSDLTTIGDTTQAVCVVLDHTPDPAVVTEAIRATWRGVVHVVLPLAHMTPTELDRFAVAVADRLCIDAPRIVHATFHPELTTSSPDAASLLVTALRRSPDPFVQFLPFGILDGTASSFGITLAAAAFLEAAYHGLREASLAAVVAGQLELRDERRRRYSQFVDQFGPFSW